MLHIPCPYCGKRAETEFRYAGEAHRPRDIETDDERWTAYLYVRDNRRGDHAERWRHIHGCGQFFNVIRNTVSDRIVCSYLATADRPGAGEGA